MVIIISCSLDAVPLELDRVFDEARNEVHAAKQGHE
jgi:hypothetical protein